MNFPKVFAAIAALALLNAGTETGAADSALRRATLKGLPGVYVLVESFDEQEKAAGFDERTFQTDVELKLRLAGIKVLAEKERLATPGDPMLYLNIGALHKQPGQIHAFSISLKLGQRVRLFRNDDLAFSTTWSLDSFGIKDLPFIRNNVKDLVDMFINAWLSVNPKPNSKPSKDSPQKED